MKLKEIIVLPKRAIPQLESPLYWAMISVVTLENTWPENSDQNCKKTLRLAFHDADPNCFDTTGYEDELFDEKRANLICDFVNEIKDEVDMLVVHCEAGVSRSPAIAGAISKFMFDDDSKFFKSPYTPNMYVYRKLLETYFKYHK